MRVVAFRHAPLEGVGLIGEALTRRGVACDVVDPVLPSRDLPSRDLPSRDLPSRDLPSGDLPSRDRQGAVAGLILMGGSMSVNDDLPWLRREENCIREAVKRGVPVLGVCLGAQLIAKALGARVSSSPVKEIGWAPVYWTGAAASDRLFAGLSGPETLFHWHGETFDLPAGAELLAYSDGCARQAFRVGNNVYGLQFHLEVTPSMIEEWIRQDASCGSAREVEGPIDAHAHAARAAEVAATVFDRWCGLLR
jgi:GMP synthase (glutamine-hydrolysing)